MHSLNRTYKEAIDYISKFQFHGFKLGLERMEAIASALKNPHKKYPSIHIAGTNGKGSVCAFLEAILRVSGIKTGLYTSPHLYTLRERFRIDGRLISKDELTNLIFEVRNLIERGFELSYFEFTTIIAMLWFARKGVDIAIFETGLGGRLDATNIIEPIISIITNISIDHKSFLGNTIEEIAYEKAGIIKQNGIVVTGVKDKSALKVIEDISERKGAVLYRIDRDFFYELNNKANAKHNITLCYNYNICHNISNHDTKEAIKESAPTDNPCIIDDIEVGLTGRHQAENASIASFSAVLLRHCFAKKTNQLISPLNNIFNGIFYETIRKGIGSASWPARGEIIEASLRGIKPPSKRFVLIDGAHNEAGIIALTELLRELKGGAKGAFVNGLCLKGLVWAMSNEGGDKDFIRLFSIIAPLFDVIVITEPTGPRQPVTIEEWKRHLDNSPLLSTTPQPTIIMEKSWDKALNTGISKLSNREDLLTVSGSLYLCGAVRNYLINHTTS